MIGCRSARHGWPHLLLLALGLLLPLLIRHDLIFRTAVSLAYRPPILTTFAFFLFGLRNTRTSPRSHQVALQRRPIRC